MSRDFLIPVVAIVAGLAAAVLVRLTTQRYARRHHSRLAATVGAQAVRPLFLLLPVTFGRIVQPLLDLKPHVAPTVRHAATLVLIFAMGWLLIALASVPAAYLRTRPHAGSYAEGYVRLLTRVGILERFFTVVVLVCTAAAMLMTFPDARAIGASILASAGVAGIILGIAARPATESLIAGLQVALTEPFHIQDVVIVDGEWGRIEEIASTYVVVRVWDRRRLVVPLGYILARPFQNWTRWGTNLIAQVTVDVDYSTPVAEVREAARRIVDASPLWDREFWNLQVTEAGERTMRLRVLATATDSDHAWDLRCHIREGLIAHLQQHYPWALPRLRATVEVAPPREPRGPVSAADESPVSQPALRGPGR
jgi:small-conductance mechanosensitive channel